MAETRTANGDKPDQLVNDPASQLFASLADFYRENGLLPEAIEICRSGLENNPDNLEGRLVLAKCFLAARDFGKAREQVTRVLSTQPENTAAKRLLGDIDRQDIPAASVQAAGPPPVKAAEPPPAEARPKLEYVESAEAEAKAGPEPPAIPPPAGAKPAPARPQEEPPPIQDERGPQGNYHRVLQDLVQTPQIMAGLLVDESGFVVASAYDPKSQAATQEEAAGALAVSIFRTGREAMQRIRMGDLEKIVIDTAGEKIFLNRAGPMLLLVSAETSAKVGLVAVNTRQAVDRVRSHGAR